MFIFAIDRIAVLEDFARRHCLIVNCGVIEDGEKVSCAGPKCGEMRMAEPHQRELQCMRDLKTFIEWYERAEIAKTAAAAKAGKR